MMNIKELEAEIISEFDSYDDWIDKYNHLIEIGKATLDLDPKYKEDKYLIKGCQSRVWLHAALENGLVVFRVDSDALITKGIAGLLVRVLSNQPAKAIVETDLTFVEAIGLKEHLSPTRSNGLVSMIKQMKLYALALGNK